MAYTPTSHKIGIQGIAVTSTVQNHPLGTIINAADPVYGEGEFIYLQGAANTVVGSVVAYNQAAGSSNGVEYGTTTLTVLASKGPVVVAMSANVANQFGWYQVVGCAQVLTSVATAVNVPVYATATAGQVSAAVTAGAKIDGMLFTVATAGNALGTAQIDGPSLNNNG
jgi:hypothetical protein